jgi:hypothetical protein
LKNDLKEDLNKETNKRIQCKTWTRNLAWKLRFEKNKQKPVLFEKLSKSNKSSVENTIIY